MGTSNDGAGVRGLSQEDLTERVRALAGRQLGIDPAGLEAGSFRDQAWLRVPRDGAIGLFEALRDDPELSFEMLVDVTCVHYPRRGEPDGEFDVVYQLVSLSRGHRYRLKISCPDAEAGVASVVPVWSGANLMEREAYDMFGVRFEGHPDLRRVLMPDDYDGWPLRKDFPYRGH